MRRSSNEGRQRPALGPLPLACAVLAIVLPALVSVPARAQALQNPDFETGSLAGWVADDNWKVDDNSAGGWYSGWEGRWFAWSGQGGEPAMGRLRSAPFLLDKEGVEVWLAGWADHQGRTADRWNYVTLNLADGTELDRCYAPNTTVFTPMILSGAGHQGEQAYLEAVDDAPEPVYSMLCIDHVRTVDLPGVGDQGSGIGADAITLENDLYRVEMNRQNGSITRVLDRQAGLELIQEPRLAGAFRLSLPLRGEEAWQATEGNYISSQNQHLSSYSLQGNRLALEWGPPLVGEAGERYDVSVVMVVELAEGEVRFRLWVRNRTGLEVGEVYYPVLGGLVGLGKEAPGIFADPKRTELVVPAGAGLQSARIFHTFVGMFPFGTYGVEQAYAYPETLSMPWAELYHPGLDRGVYFGAHDPVARFKALHLEMLPGVSGPRARGNWPTPAELDGLPAGVRMSWVHIVYHPPGLTFEATPVVLRFHDGGWRQGARIYADWFLSRLKKSLPGGPAEESLARVPRVPFAELTARAREAMDQGTGLLLLTDWKVGGHSDGIPRFQPDPELGGAAELAEAVRACQELGAKIILRLNLQHVSQRGEWYRDELHDHACRDRWGILYSVMGWGGGPTFSGRLAGGERRVWVNPGAPGLQRELVRQAEDLARLGVDGIHLESFLPRALDFNPEVGTTPDRAGFERPLQCMEAMLSACRAVNPDFQLSVEVVGDHLLPYTTVLDARVPDASPFREAFPSWETLAPPR